MVTHTSILAWRIPWTEKPGYRPRGHKEEDTTKATEDNFFKFPITFFEMLKRTSNSTDFRLLFLIFSNQSVYTVSVILYLSSFEHSPPSSASTIHREKTAMSKGGNAVVSESHSQFCSFAFHGFSYPVNCSPKILNGKFLK